MSAWLTKPRLAGVMGLAYFLGVSIENQEVLGAPGLESSADSIRESLADSTFAWITYTAGALALVAYVGFVVCLYLWLREDDRARPWATIALIGGIGGPLAAVFGQIHEAALLSDLSGSDDDRVTGLHDTYLRARIVSGIFVAMFAAGFGMAGLRTGRLPRELSWLLLALAPAMAVAPIAALDSLSELEPAVTIAFAIQTVWIFLTSIWLTLGGEGVPATSLLRRSAFLLLVIAAGAIGLALLAAPGATGEFFAWALKPEPLAAFSGGVYVGSAAAYALALPRTGREARGLVLGAAVLSVSVFLITLTHGDQFDYGRLQAVMWVILFGGFSVTMLSLLAIDREDEGASGAALAGPARAILAAVAALLGVLAVALWIDPTGLEGPSPFDLPALGGRFAGSWIGMLAAASGWAALRSRADEARPVAWLLTLVPTGALLAGLRTLDQLDDGASCPLYLAALAALSLAGVAVLRATRS
jgi:hypothetical protein